MILEDHTIGFRQSPQYGQWKALLHPFYDPFPTVEHYGAPWRETSGGLTNRRIFSYLRDGAGRVSSPLALAGKFHLVAP